MRLKGDGSYAVSLALGGRHMGWMLTRKPLRHGQLVEVVAAKTDVRPLGPNAEGTLSVLHGGALRILPSRFARRVVSPAWLDRVGRAMRRPLYAYQVEGAGWLAQRLTRGRGAILADEPGLGKTAQALAALVALGSTPFVVVAPSSAKMAWIREARYLAVDLRLAEIEGVSGPLPPAHGYVLNYDILRAREEQLGALRARALVLDEAHHVKEPEPTYGHRAQVATRLGRKIGRILMLTGSPLLNRPSEWWRLLHLAEPEDWPDYTSFRWRYCIRPDPDDPSPGTSVVTGHGEVHRLEELQTLADKVALRRLKEDLLAALPPKRRRSVLCELEPSDRAHYDKAEKNVVEWLRGVRSDVAARAAARNEALVKLTMLRHIAAVGKLRRALPRYLQHWFVTTRQPLVIFAYHTDVVRGTAGLCRHLGLRLCGITGKTPAPKRALAVDRFSMGDADVFVAPIRAAGISLNLQAAAHCLFLERLWTPSLLSQAEDRLHRIGQGRAVTVTYLDAARTVDQYVADVVEAKQRLIRRVVDDVSEDDAIRETTETLAAVVGRLAVGTPGGGA